MGIRWIKINFYRLVRGRVIKKEWSKSYDAYTVVVKNDDESVGFEFNRYIVDKKTFGTLRKNAVNTFQGIFAGNSATVKTDFKLSAKKWL